MKAYSQDVREKVLRAVDQGKPRREIVDMFGVSLATLKRYLKQRRETGNVLPKPIPGRPSQKYAPLQAGLVAQLQAHPDVMLEEHCRLWEEAHSMQVSPTTMSRAIRRVGWTRKKNAGCLRTQRGRACRLASGSEPSGGGPIDLCGRVWLHYCAHAYLCACPQGPTSAWERSAQPWQEYHAHRLTLAGGDGSSDDPGGTSQWRGFRNLR